MHNESKSHSLPETIILLLVYLHPRASIFTPPILISDKQLSDEPKFQVYNIIRYMHNESKSHSLPETIILLLVYLHPRHDIVLSSTMYVANSFLCDCYEKTVRTLPGRILRNSVDIHMCCLRLMPQKVY